MRSGLKPYSKYLIFLMCRNIKSFNNISQRIMSWNFIINLFKQRFNFFRIFYFGDIGSGTYDVFEIVGKNTIFQATSHCRVGIFISDFILVIFDVFCPKQIILCPIKTGNRKTALKRQWKLYFQVDKTTNFFLSS